LLCAIVPLNHSSAADAKVYFSPDGGAQDAVVGEINQAKSEILLQAYSFTSAPIAQALVNAHKRGVTITAILDKSNEKAKYSAATFLLNAGIPVYIDYRPAIAHSKIMIIDRATIITGSFNFTKAAEHNNAENLLVLKKDPQLVARYLQNFNNRLSLSRPSLSRQQ
jgi:phosphatidylserine/phosphatidylglycerophosphate/cardiolipin synthase-like enzyme